MSFKINPIIIVCVLLVLGLFSFLVFKIHKQSQMITDINTQVIAQKELQDSITRSQNQYAKAEDINKLAEDINLNLNVIKKDLGKLNADVKSINVVTVKSQGVIVKDVESTNTGEKNPNKVPNSLECIDNKCQNPDKFGYLNEEQRLMLVEPFETNTVPLGEVSFSAWKDAPWGLELYPREYLSTTVVGEDENQRHYFYNKFSVKVQDKVYDLKIEKANTLTEYPEAKFHLFNPRLYLGVDGGFYLNKLSPQFGPNIGINFMSYGRYLTQPDFTILGVGLGYDSSQDQSVLLINPFSYNIANHLPLVNNMYLGPSLTVDRSGGLGVVLNLSVGL